MKILLATILMAVTARADSGIVTNTIPVAAPIPHMVFRDVTASPSPGASPTPTPTSVVILHKGDMQWGVRLDKLNTLNLYPASEAWQLRYSLNKYGVTTNNVSDLIRLEHMLGVK